MNWKIILALFIIIGITGLLIFSDKGSSFREKYLDKYIKSVGNFFSGITSKFKFNKPYPNNTFEFSLSANSDILKGQNFDVNSINFDGTLEYNSMMINNQNINMKEEKNIDLKANNMAGTILIDSNNIVTISGQSAYIELNGLIFSPKNGEKVIDFSVSGKPVKYLMSNVYREEIAFTGVSGLLTLKDLSPMSLKSDTLILKNFLGEINQDKDLLSISGKIEKARLNGIDLVLGS
jgi:hypothetical protein